MKKIILASGLGDRWSGNTPKQLIKLKGEVLLKRTLRQFGDDCIVVCWDKKIKRVAKNSIEVKNRRYTCDTLLSAMNVLGKDDYIVLLGDVFWGDKTVEIIKNDDSDLQFYGDKDEIYGLKFKSKMFGTVENKLKELEEIISRPKGKNNQGHIWDLYQCFTKVGRGMIRYNFYYVNDETTDFDRQIDYDNFVKCN